MIAFLICAGVYLISMLVIYYRYMLEYTTTIDYVFGILWLASHVGMAITVWLL